MLYRVAWVVWGVCLAALLYAIWFTDHIVAAVAVGPFAAAMLYISDKKRKAL